MIRGVQFEEDDDRRVRIGNNAAQSLESGVVGNLAVNHQGSTRARIGDTSHFGERRILSDDWVELRDMFAGLMQADLLAHEGVIDRELPSAEARHGEQAKDGPPDAGLWLFPLRCGGFAHVWMGKQVLSR